MHNNSRPVSKKITDVAVWCCRIGASGEVPIRVARAAPSTVAIHLAESRSRFPDLFQYFCIPLSADSAADISLAGRTGQVGQIIPSGSQPSATACHALPPTQMSLRIWSPSVDRTTSQSASASVAVPLEGTYSEIVWLEASWTAPTRANANRTTGLPNSYAGSG